MPAGGSILLPLHWGQGLVVSAALRAGKVGASGCAKDPGYGVVKRAEKGPSLGPLRLGLIP